MKEKSNLVLPWWGKTLFVLFGIALGLGAIDLALRFFPIMPEGSEFESVDELRAAMRPDGISSEGPTTLKDLIYPHDDDRIIYDLRPNLDLTFQRVRVQTNSCGMRSPERPISKPPGTVRIALLGDSFTFGWGVRQEGTFAQRIEDNLNRLLPRQRTEVLNFGVPGYSTFQEVYQFFEKGVQFQPDVVLVFFVQNDFGPPFFVRDLGGDSLLPSTALGDLAMRFLDPNAQERALESRGLDPNRALRALSERCKELGIPLFLVINPKKDWRVFHRQLWILKQDRSIRFLRLREDFLEVVKLENIPTEDLTLSFDPHPSELRHRIYGDIMTPHLLSVLHPYDSPRR